MMSQTIFVSSIFTVIRDWVYNNVISNFAENAKTAGSVALLGMVTVFSVLAILWLVIEIFHAVLTAAEKSKGKPKKKKKKAGSAETAPELPAVTEPAVIIDEAPVPQDDEAEIVAAISAALAEYLNVPQSSFRVVSFKKAANGAHWNK